MATVNAITLSGSKVRVHAEPSAVESGVTKWFKNYSSLTGGTLDTGESLDNRDIVVVAAGTALSVTANYVVGDTVAITDPDPDTEGTLSVSPAIPDGANGYPPETRLFFTFTSITSSNKWVSAWSGATVDSINPNVATAVTGVDDDEIAVSVTVTGTTPGSRRVVTVTTPDTSAVSVAVAS